MSRIIREAKTKDMAEIMKVMDAAKQIMRQSGNMHQWGEGYPSVAVINADMEKGGGFVVEDDGMIVGYFAFLQSPEPTYQKIYGANGLTMNNRIMWFIELPAILKLAAFSAASWTSVSHTMQTFALIRIATTKSCSTTS